MDAPVAALLARIRGDLRALADPQFRASIQRFFREPVDAWGVRTPAVRRLAATLFREVRTWPAARRNRLCNELWKSGKLEESSVAVCLYEKLARQCGACEFHLFEKWIDRFAANWAHCDGICKLLWATFENEPDLPHHVSTWTASPNRWKRRAAVVALVREAKRGRHTKLLLEIAGSLLDDPDDMVQKGVGWLLKEAYPPRPKEVARFLVVHHGRIPPLVRRIAAEKMPRRPRAPAPTMG